jgi:hypothetical protein
MKTGRIIASTDEPVSGAGLVGRITMRAAGSPPERGAGCPNGDKLASAPHQPPAPPPPSSSRVPQQANPWVVPSPRRRRIWPFIVAGVAVRGHRRRGTRRNHHTQPKDRQRGQSRSDKQLQFRTSEVGSTGDDSAHALPVPSRQRQPGFPGLAVRPACRRGTGRPSHSSYRRRRGLDQHHRRWWPQRWRVLIS